MVISEIVAIINSQMAGKPQALATGIRGQIHWILREENVETASLYTY